ncbi:MAG: Uma2 family endonuclease [Gemmataceae bacterium]|nr:Uma2 family endonuclease [Gemmataceae bacterium]
MPGAGSTVAPAEIRRDDDDELYEIIDGKRVVKDAPIPDLGRDDSDELYEVIDGVRTVKSMGFLASIIATRLARHLGIYAEDHDIGLVILESIYTFSDAATRRPDISLVSFEQLAKITNLRSDPAEPELTPRLAVEVISPTNTAVAVERKLLKYFAAGVEAVWVVHPLSQRIYAYDSPTACKILEMAGTLDGGKLLPGFSMPVAEVFNIPTLPA